MGEWFFPAWDPVLLQIGFLQLRWYSLMYVVGFVVGHWILTRLAKSGFFPVPAEKVSDLVFALILGVMLGGRIGYCVFYRPELIASWRLIAVWEGGLSFHGGLLGVVVTAIVWSRRQRISTWRLLDCLALAVTPGILAVRLANFVNGELYGRTTDASVPCAMRFPTDPVALQRLGIPAGAGIRERETAIMAAIEDGTWAEIRDTVPLRHPSQLYEALGEGVILGLVMLVCYRVSRHRPWGRGVYGGIFALGYGAVRFVIEYFRQPDAQFRDPDDPLGTVLGPLTMGQVLCAAMILFGVGLIMWAWNRRDPVAQEAVDG